MRCIESTGGFSADVLGATAMLSSTAVEYGRRPRPTDWRVSTSIVRAGCVSSVVGWGGGLPYAGPGPVAREADKTRYCPGTLGVRDPQIVLRTDERSIHLE